MIDTVTPRLCAGTYFVLLLEARKPRLGAKVRLESERDGLSEKNIYLELSRVVAIDVPDPPPFMEKTFKTSTFNFKSCKDYGSNYFLLGDPDARQLFDERIKKEYARVLDDMSAFIDQFINVGGSLKKDIKLVKALLDLIDQDDSIKSDQPFYICEDGHPITKSQICSETHFCIDAFLLGVWHYALLRPEGNEIGQDTYNAWCPSNNGAHRDYQGNMGDNLNREITISRRTEAVVESCDISSCENPEEETTVEFEDTPEQTFEPQPQMPKQNIFQFVMNGNHGTQIGNVERYYSSQKDEQDEQ